MAPMGKDEAVDYFSVPQPSAASAAEMEETLRNMKAAIDSIPAYIERSSHFFAVVPTLRHQDLSCVTCDYGSWLRRGWCRLELNTLQLARFGTLPAIVVKVGAVSPP